MKNFKGSRGVPYCEVEINTPLSLDMDPTLITSVSFFPQWS